MRATAKLDPYNGAMLACSHRGTQEIPQHAIHLETFSHVDGERGGGADRLQRVQHAVDEVGLVGVGKEENVASERRNERLHDDEY